MDFEVAVDDGVDAVEVAQQVLRVEGVIRRRLAGVLAKEGVSTEEWLVLEALWGRDGRTQGELAEATWRERPTVTRLVDGLVERGLVVREEDAFDKRRKRARLTEAGRGLAEPMRGKVRAAVDELLGGHEAAGLRSAFELFDAIGARLWDP